MKIEIVFTCFLCSVTAVTLADTNATLSTIASSIASINITSDINLNSSVTNTKPLNDEKIAKQATRDSLGIDIDVPSCDTCIFILKSTKFLSHLPEKLFTGAMKSICKLTGLANDEMCVNFVKEQGPVIRQVLKNMDISGRAGYMFCGSALNACPYPVTEPWNVTFPKPKPDLQHYRRPISIGKNFTVLQLSDFHVDLEYLPGSEANCGGPLCCRPEFTDFKNITRPASIWGDYKCDSPLILINSLLKYIPTVEPEISFGILTGDVPSHEVWSTLPTIKTKLILDESYRLLHSYFDSPYLINSTLYPAVGNHDAAPANQFPLKKSSIPLNNKDLGLGWLYQSLIHSWQNWVPSNVTDKLADNFGSYALRPTKGLKLISLNTVFCYTLNWWMYEYLEKNPNGIFTWLIKELQDSEDREERVWIIGHIPPGDSTCFHDYSDTYNIIMDRYSHIIASQFFGHTHRDEFSVFYRKNKPRTSTNAISVGYISPSITPYTDLNPGFRTYRVDTETFEILDANTYIASLGELDKWTDQPNWHFEYSAREAYNSSIAKLENDTSPLTPAWWHNVTIDMEINNQTFDKYYTYRSKSSSIMEKCDSSCKQNIICNCRAGNSKFRCDFV